MMHDVSIAGALSTGISSKRQSMRLMEDELFLEAEESMRLTRWQGNELF